MSEFEEEREQQQQVQQQVKRNKTTDAFSKKVTLLRLLSSNINSRIEALAKDVGVSRSQAYNILREFSEGWVMTEDEPNFPEKLLDFYNDQIPDEIEPVSKNEILELKTVVDRVMKRSASAADIPETRDSPSGSIESNNSSNMSEDRYRTMSENSIPEYNSDELLLRDILSAQTQAPVSKIDKFMKVFSMMKQQWITNPDDLKEYMKGIFGPTAGENSFLAWKKAHPMFIYDAPSNGNGNGGGMDPMMMMMMMGGGDMSSMLPMMMGGNGGNGNGNAGSQMNMLMMSLAAKAQAKQKEKEDRNEMFDKALQTLMLSFVGNSMGDRKPLDPSGMGGQYQIQEVLDENKQVKARNYTPYLPGMAVNGGQPQSNPILEMILAKSMDREQMLMAQVMKSGEPLKEILIGLFPHFRANSNPLEQIAQLRTAFPEIWPKGTDPNAANVGGGNIDALKLKFDTELAMQAQKTDLMKMQHQWDMEKIDRQNANENARGWMEMLGTVGEKIVSPFAQSMLAGFGSGMMEKLQNKLGGGGGGAAGGAGGGAGGPTPQQMAQIQAMRQAQAAQMAQQQRGPPQQQMEQQPPPQQPSVDPTMMMIMMQQMQENNRKQEETIKNLQQRAMGLAQQVQHLSQPQQIDPERIKTLDTAILKQALDEEKRKRRVDDQIASVIENELYNREFLGTPPTQDEDEEDQEQEIEYITPPSDKLPAIPEPKTTQIITKEEKPEGTTTTTTTTNVTEEEDLEEGYGGKTGIRTQQIDDSEESIEIDRPNDRININIEKKDVED